MTLHCNNLNFVTNNILVYVRHTDMALSLNSVYFAELAILLEKKFWLSLELIQTRQKLLELS